MASNHSIFKTIRTTYTPQTKKTVTTNQSHEQEQAMATNSTKAKLAETNDVKTYINVVQF